MTGIYKITNPKGRVYIGQSINIHNRFKQYSKIRNSKGQILLHRSFLKYGIDFHSFEILCECDVDDLNNMERFYQDLFNTYNEGMNCKLTSTKDKSGKLSQQTKNKIGLANKGKKRTKEEIERLKQRKPTMYGKKHTKETRDKMKESAIKRGCSSEQLKKISELNKNKKHSKEMKLKMSLNRIGKGKGSSNGKATLLIDEETGVFYETITEASLYFPYTPSHLTNMVRGHRKNTTSLRIA